MVRGVEVQKETETNVPRQGESGRQAERNDHAMNSVHGSFGDISVDYGRLGRCSQRGFSPLGHSEKMQDQLCVLDDERAKDTLPGHFTSTYYRGLQCSYTYTIDRTTSGGVIRGY